METVLVFLVTGAAAGVLAGLFGVGGGLIVVPALAFILPTLGTAPPVVMQSAIGTSLAVVGLTAISSTRSHHARGGVLWPVFRKLAPGIVIGSFIGATAAHHVGSTALRICVGVGALLISIQMFVDAAPKATRTPPGTLALSGVGALIGSLSALIGIGGGSLTVPYLTACNIDMRRAVGTSAACGIPIAWAGAAGFAINGHGVPGLAPWSLGYIDLAAFAGIAAMSVLTAPLGARLAHGVSPKLLKRAFAIFLALVSLRMLTSG
ncbi:sulfite exporter TauE/SafE family protein [Nevskia sp.]|uniref:sulfite exporter TauE/SafE family protein n=1 Tax=Nevskia sp. TaxID=1929292 RepID=UPI0025DCA256|nr:sulfite exporter TauE/SafE family protein [Nevskia sp.]